VPSLTTTPELGQGIYTFPEAARIITRSGSLVSPRQLRYWIHRGLTPSAHKAGGFTVLTFTDLVSLEAVRRFRTCGVSLQAVRKLERVLRQEYPNIGRPFAHQIFFTDGVSVWAEVNPGESDVIEVLGRHPRQYAWRSAIRSFAEEIRFGEDRTAEAWVVSHWVEIAPDVQFGAPVVRGTRIPIRTIAANLEVGSPKEVADWYELSVDQVEGVRKYLAEA
jgi:uncharacterized protein (DUF433 family)/DNA-binding transcriptional MerR regulator